MIRLSRLPATPVRAACIALIATAWAGAGHANELLSAHVPPSVSQHAATLVGQPDAAQVMHISIALPMRNQAELDRLLADLYDPASPQFRQFLSVAEFTERFGPKAADYARAVQYFGAHGLTVTATAANRYLIEAEAPVGTLEKVLNVKFNTYRHVTQDRSFVAPDREPTLDLDVKVLHIVGLDDEVLPTPRLKHRGGAIEQASGVKGSAPGGYYLGSDIRAAYYGNGPLDGAGQSVGLMELAAFYPQSITNYFTQFGPPLTTQVVGVSADGTTNPVCQTACDDGEQALDIEYAIAMAPGMSSVQVYVARSPESVLNKMVADNTCAQLSTSWGWRESQVTDDAIFQEMAAQGQTNLTASGDYSSLNQSGPWPEESAWITGVGGTDLQTVSAGGAWASETGWIHSAGGPSTDPNILIPTYQLPFINKKNMGSKTLRNVPDIAGDSDTVNYICESRGCGGGWGGTSFASPIWSGFMALANQQSASEGKGRIGWLNPIVYAIGGEKKKQVAAAFHDAVGNSSGLYATVKGFDLVTGFGSPNGDGMIKALIKQVGQ